MITPYLLNKNFKLPAKTGQPVEAKLRLKNALCFTPFFENRDKLLLDVSNDYKGSFLDTLSAGTMVKIHRHLRYEGHDLYFVSVSNPGQRTQGILEKLYYRPLTAPEVRVFGWIKNPVLESVPQKQR